MKQNKPEFHKEPSQVTDKLAPLHFQGHLGKAPELGSLNMPKTWQHPGSRRIPLASLGHSAERKRWDVTPVLPDKAGGPQAMGTPDILLSFQNFPALAHFSSQGLKVKWDVKVPSERCGRATSQDSSL